jgi:hypothetical protein
VHLCFRLRFDFPHGEFRVLPVGISVAVVFDFLKETGIGIEEVDALFKTALYIVIYVRTLFMFRHSFMFVPYLCLDTL